MQIILDSAQHLPLHWSRHLLKCHYSQGSKISALASCTLDRSSEILFTISCPVALFHPKHVRPLTPVLLPNMWNFLPFSRYIYETPLDVTQPSASDAEPSNRQGSQIMITDSIQVLHREVAAKFIISCLPLRFCLEANAEIRLPACQKIYKCLLSHPPCPEDFLF